jgi:hypothetical protein
MSQIPIQIWRAGFTLWLLEVSLNTIREAVTVCCQNVAVTFGGTPAPPAVFG